MHEPQEPKVLPEGKANSIFRGKKQAETMESVFHSHVKTEKALLSMKRKYEIQASSKVRAENSCIHSKRNNNEISPNDIFGNQI